MNGALIHIPSPILLAALLYAGWRIALAIARAVEADDDERSMREYERRKRSLR